MLRSSLALRVVLVFFAILAAVTSANAAPSWFDGNRGFAFNVPDYYQHQRWGLTANGLLDSWEFETGGLNPPNTGDWGGWCRTTAITNGLYYWKAKQYGEGAAARFPYGDLLSDDFSRNDKWLDAVNAEIPKLTKHMFDDRKPISDYFHNHRVADFPAGSQVGEGKVLVATREYWGNYIKKLRPAAEIVKTAATDDIVVYQGFDGKFYQHKVAGNKMFEAYKEELFLGNNVELTILKYDSVAYDASLWWGNYHNLTGVGLNLAGNQIIFADPDSNKGSFKPNAGMNWDALVKPGMPGVAGPAGTVGTPGTPLDPTMMGDRGDAAVYNRRYLATDPVPVPPRAALNLPNDASGYLPFYGVLSIADDGRTVCFDVAANERYKGVTIGELILIAPAAAGRGVPRPVPSPSPGADGVAFAAALPPTLQQSVINVAGPADAVMDDVWIFANVEPASLAPPQITMHDTSVNLPGWQCDVTSTDPAGNVRSPRGVRCELTGAGSPLDAATVADISFPTFGDLSAFDVFFRDPTNPETYSVQVHGASSDGPYIGLQVPEPTAAVLSTIGAACLLSIRRRKAH